MRKRERKRAEEPGLKTVQASAVRPPTEFRRPAGSRPFTVRCGSAGALQAAADSLHLA